MPSCLIKKDITCLGSLCHGTVVWIIYSTNSAIAFRFCYNNVQLKDLFPVKIYSFSLLPVFIDLVNKAYPKFSRCRSHRPACVRRSQRFGDTAIYCPIHTARQTRQDGPVCVVSGVPVWIGRLPWTRSDFIFSAGDSLELSEIQFTPPKRTRHRQDSFVVSGEAVWIGSTSNLVPERRLASVRGFWSAGPDAWNSLSSHLYFINDTAVSKHKLTT